MGRLYLSTKQILFLLAPLLFIIYLIIVPKSSTEFLDSVFGQFDTELSYKKDYSIVAKESVEKKYFMSIDSIKRNQISYQNSLFETNKDLTNWIIAYSFKYVDVLYKNKTKVQPEVKAKGITGKISKLQSMVDKRNQDIQATLEIGQKSDTDEIWQLIKKRNLINPSKMIKVKVINPPLEMDKYDLQMIMLSGKGSEVIINDKIYKLYQYIDNDVKLIKIKENKILLKNKKEKRWLKLIK